MAGVRVPHLPQYKFFEHYPVIVTLTNRVSVVLFRRDEANSIRLVLPEEGALPNRPIGGCAAAKNIMLGLKVPTK